MAGQSSPQPPRLKLHPAVDLAPIADAVTASVRGPYLSGTRELKLGNWEAALKHFIQALPQANVLEAQALSELIGTMLLRNGELNAALVQFEQLLAAARGRSDPRGESRQLYNLGVTHTQLGELEVAERQFQEARRLAQSIPDEVCLAFAEYGLAELCGRAGRSKEAAEFEAHAIKLTQDAHDESLMLRVFIGPECGLEGAVDSVREMYTERYLAGRRGDPHKDLEIEARREQKAGRPEKARAALRRMLDLAVKAKNEKREASALRGFASVFMQEDDWPQALHYLRRALEITHRLSPPPTVALAMRTVASAAAKTGDFDGAVAQLVEAYRYCQQHEDLERQRETANAFVDLAVEYDFIDRLPEMCVEHGLSADEVRQLVDEAQQWTDLYGYEGPPGPEEDEHDEP